MSRQFVDMQRSRIESLLSAFPKLMGTNKGTLETKRQHTFIETDSVRYLFQPLEGVYYSNNQYRKLHSKNLGTSHLL